MASKWTKVGKKEPTAPPAASSEQDFPSLGGNAGGPASSSLGGKAGGPASSSLGDTGAGVAAPATPEQQHGARYPAEWGPAESWGIDVDHSQ